MKTFNKAQYIIKFLTTNRRLKAICNNLRGITNKYAYTIYKNGTASSNVQISLSPIIPLAYWTEEVTPEFYELCKKQLGFLDIPIPDNLDTENSEFSDNISTGG